MKQTFFAVAAVAMMMVLSGCVQGGNIIGAYDDGSSLVVVQYETECSTVTTIGTAPVSMATSNKCAYDAKYDVLYVFGTDSTGAKSVYGINGTTGAVTSVTPLAFHQVHLDYDPNAGKLLVIGEGASNTLSQYYVEIGTGKTQLLNTVPSQYGNFLGEGSSFDYVNGIQWFDAFDNVAFLAYEVGLAVKGGVYQVLDPNNAGTPAFSGSPDGTMVGLGYNGNRTIVKWSASSSSTQMTSKVHSSWDITYNSQNALDTTNNILYAVLDNGPPYMDQFWAGINTGTGYTYSAVLVRPTVQPWCSFYRS